MIRRAGCAELSELRSAFVDQALSDRDRERLLSHLVGCDACRGDVEDLRRVRRLLATPQPRVDAPGDLSSRLISIAATTRPARRWPISPRLVAAGLALLLVVTSTAAAGYAAAPPVTPAVAGDPSAEAVNEFGGMLASLPLTDQSVDVVAAIRPSKAGPVQSPRSVTPSGVARELGPTAAQKRLAAAARTAKRESFAGTQRYWALREDIQINAGVDVVNVAGQGMELRVRDSTGKLVQSRFVRESGDSRLSELTLVGLLADNYTLSGWPGSEVAGRRATVIEAVADGRTAARWWVDDATALVLWQETYDGQGRVQTSTGYTSVRFGEVPFLSHLPQAPVRQTTTSLTLDTTRKLAAQGWSPPDTLAGLPLVRLRSDHATDPQVLHLVYSDGLSVLSVFEQRGGLDAGPAGTRWDDRLQAYVRWGSASTASWQSGETVLTVVSNGAPELMTQAVSALPHQAVPVRTTMGRVLAGWDRILGRA
jgi:hypothetical protein